MSDPERPHDHGLVGAPCLIPLTPPDGPPELLLMVTAADGGQVWLRLTRETFRLLCVEAFGTAAQLARPRDALERYLREGKRP